MPPLLRTANLAHCLNDTMKRIGKKGMKVRSRTYRVPPLEGFAVDGLGSGFFFFYEKHAMYDAIANIV